MRRAIVEAIDLIKVNYNDKVKKKSASIFLNTILFVEKVNLVGALGILKYEIRSNFQKRRENKKK